MVQLVIIAGRRNVEKCPTTTVVQSIELGMIGINYDVITSAFSRNITFSKTYDFPLYYSNAFQSIGTIYIYQTLQPRSIVVRVQSYSTRIDKEMFVILYIIIIIIVTSLVDR